MTKLDMDNKIKKIFDKIKSYTELLKSIILVILFCTVLVLVSIYIVMTYEETIDSGSMINVNSMIFMPDKTSAPTNITDAMLTITPSIIGYKYESVSKAVIGNKNIIDSIYYSFSNEITEYLSSDAKCIVYSEHEGNALLTKCLNSEKYVYFKFHNTYVSSMLRAYTDITASADLTKFADGEILSVSEILLTYYLDQWRLLTIDGNGTVAEYKIEKDNTDFDISWLAAYNDNKAFIDFQFGYNASKPDLGFTYERTAIISNDIVNAKYFNAVKPSNLVLLQKATQDQIADLFFINLDRAGKFDSSESKDYIDSHGTLSFSSEGMLTYSAADTNGGVDLSNYIGYENHGESYSIDEILRACARLMYSLDSMEEFIAGGSAYMSLNGVSVDGGNIIVEFGYYFDNIALVDEEGRSVVSARIVCDGKKILSVSVLSVGFIESPDKNPMLPQSWILSQMDFSNSESDENMLLTVTPLYILPKVEDLSYDNSYIHAQWIFKVK